MNDEELLINAWIDGELEPEKALQAAKLAAAKPELLRLSEQLLQMQRLNLAAAFQQTTPAMPAALQQSLQKAVLQNNKPESTEEQAQIESTSSPWFGTLAKAAAIVLSIGLGYSLGNLPTDSNDSELATWSEAVLSYQNLYLRETVTDSAVSAEEAALLIENHGLSRALESVSGKNISAIAQLNEKGFNFSRAQMLAYNETKLLQMVYLADEGLPLAFCVMPLSGEDTLATLRARTPAGVTASYWRHDGFAYVIVGKLPGNEIEMLAQSVRKSQQSQS